MDKRIWRMREDVAVALAGLVQELHWGAHPIVDGLLGADEDVCALLDTLGIDEPVHGLSGLAGSAAGR